VLPDSGIYLIQTLAFVFLFAISLHALEIVASGITGLRKKTIFPSFLDSHCNYARQTL
jgi:hypothetical protein